MIKKYKSISILILVMLLVSTGTLFLGCEISKTENKYTKYEESFFDTFDSLVQVIAYTNTEQEFNKYFIKIHEYFINLNKLYDMNNDYEDINNIKTINDQAGIQAVKVDQEIIDLIVFCKDWYYKTGEKNNIAMGTVLRIWDKYREDGLDEPENAQIPKMEELKEAARYIDINKVVVDEEKSTVFLKDKRMILDVEAVSRGFATEIVIKEMVKDGLVSGIISIDGNISTIGKPLDGVRSSWGIGIQNPQKSLIEEKQKHVDVVFANDLSVYSCGDYQKYYIVDKKVYHNIIDQKTLMPANYSRAVTVIAEEAGKADFICSSIFLMPYDEGRELIESLDGVDGIWELPDGTVLASEGAMKMMKSNGAKGGHKLD